MRPPVTSGSHTSGTAMSNDSVVMASSVSRSEKPGRRAIDSRKFTSAPCGTCTPLGRPVEPEV